MKVKVKYLKIKKLIKLTNLFSQDYLLKINLFLQGYWLKIDLL